MIETDCYRRIVDKAVGLKPTLRRCKYVASLSEYGGIATRVPPCDDAHALIFLSKTNEQRLSPHTI